MISFNRPYLTGLEARYVEEAFASRQMSGNGAFTKRCQGFFESRYGFRKCLLTTSCSDALEMAAMLTGVGPGDEVIVPSYTFVSSALAFVRQGATVVFCDSLAGNPNIDPAEIERLVSPRTKVIVPVHYAGVACDMDAIMAIAERHGLLVVEDAAQAVDSFYVGADGSKRPLGGIGHFGCFSFHETKNISSGEGGLLAVNDERFIRRAEILWEKGTNRAEFFRGAVNKYGWVDTGSSFLPAEMIAAFLWAQLEKLDDIQSARRAIWERYYAAFEPYAERGVLTVPEVPALATNNAHTFYMVLKGGLEQRTDFIARMKAADVNCVFHYLPLHDSKFYREYVKDHAPVRGVNENFPNCLRYADGLVRLPLYCELGEADQARVIAAAKEIL